MKASIAALLTTCSAVSATWFAMCQDRGRVNFSGINQVCSQLDSNWCSTNCNIFGYNCDVCEWIPGGPPPNKDINVLRSWCFSQEWYDSINKKDIHGTIELYSHSGFFPSGSCPTCGGCPYYNNGGSKIKRDDEPASPPGSTVTVTINSPDIEGEGGSFKLIAERCDFLYPWAAEHIGVKITYSDDHPGCKLVSATDPVQVECEVDGPLSQFRSMCYEYGGKLFLVEDGRDVGPPL